MTAIIIIRALALLLLLMHLYSRAPAHLIPPSISIIIIPCLGRPFILLPQHIHLCNPRTLSAPPAPLPPPATVTATAPCHLSIVVFLASLSNNNKIRFTCVCLMHCNPDTTIIMHFPCCTLSLCPSPPLSLWYKSCLSSSTQTAHLYFHCTLTPKRMWCAFLCCACREYSLVY